MNQTVINILLVEDDHVDVMNVQRAFKKLNIDYPLHVAYNGQEALNMLRGSNGKARLSSGPLIILTDINMPKMNGIEFINELRKDPEFETTPIFIMTTSNDLNDKSEAFKMNVAGYILKPLSFEKFASNISVLNCFWHLCEFPSSTTN
jgi:CheY-like chemotaxis protein